MNTELKLNTKVLLKGKLMVKVFFLSLVLSLGGYCVHVLKNGTIENKLELNKSEL